MVGQPGGDPRIGDGTEGIESHRHRDEHVAGGATVQEQHRRQGQDDAEPGRLQHAALPEGLVPEHHEVEQPRGQDEPGSALEEFRGHARQAAGRLAPREGERQAEADQDEEERRPHRHARVDQVVAGPAHSAVLPPAAGVVHDHQEQREATHRVQELQPLDPAALDQGRLRRLPAPPP
jgi:hypothetical protein